jgi:hypothetical protein
MDPRPVEGPVKKDGREIMEILEAFDLTGCAHSAAQLVGCDPKTVAHWVERRDRGLPVPAVARRPRLIDPFLDKIEEWVERSRGKVRADVVHERLVAVGFGGDERTTRRAVAEAKARWRAGHQRIYRPWVPSRACGVSSTGGSARWCRGRAARRGRRCCFDCGWPGRGSGW